MNFVPLRYHLVIWCAAIVALAGCDALLAETDPGDASVAVRFGTSSVESPSGSEAAVGKMGVDSTATELTIVGQNGTLVITDVRFIVEKLKLERDDAACEVAETEAQKDGCEEFEAAPFLVDLPLQGGIVEPVRAVIPAGSYTEFELEIKDLDFGRDEDEDELDDEERALLALAEHIRVEFPDWPEDASMVVVGRFTQEGEEPQPFTTYLKAEVEIELEFEEALDLAEIAANALLVQIEPKAWFSEADGSVINLAEYDFETKGELLEFEVKMKDGFTSVDIERDGRKDEADDRKDGRDEDDD